MAPVAVFGMGPKQLWLDGWKERGYEAATFTEAWDRYLWPLTPANDGDGRR
jgi:hypothetical protein